MVDIIVVMLYNTPSSLQFIFDYKFHSNPSFVSFTVNPK